MNACILLITREVAAAGAKRNAKMSMLILFGTSLGAGLLQLGILLWKGYPAYLVVSFLVIIPAMVLLFLGKTALPVYFRRLIWSYLIAMGLGGCVSAAENIFRFSQIPIWIAILCVFLVREGIRFGKREFKKQEQLCKVILQHRGKTVECMALWDTGNQLRVAEDGRAVHIIDAELFRELHITANDFVGVAGYCTLGNDDGILPLYEIDGIYMEDNIGALSRGTKAVVACAGSRLLRQKPYQVILNVEGVIV